MDKRIYEFAKELSLSSKALVDILRSMGFQVKSHMSLVTPAMMEKIQERYLEERHAVDEEYKAKKQWRKRLIPKHTKAKLPPKLGRKKSSAIIERREKIDEKKLNETVRKTLAQIELKKPVKKHRKHGEEHEVVEEKIQEIQIPEALSLRELAEKIGVDPTELIRKCLELGVVVSINSRLDFDTMSLLVEDYGFKAVLSAGFVQTVAEKKEEVPTEKLIKRPPVITILGHVDHGKTTLLDYIRGSNLVAGEYGGITQRIGAYQVDSPYGKMTFIDTPGHYAFTAMRARGAQVTDIAVLVVAWDDGVMPQTVEAISHAKAAGVPIIVAVNKMDMPGATPDKALQQLSEHGLLIEEWGGKTLWTPISAKTGEGVNKLLELIALVAETLDLRANADTKATGVVIEAVLDRGKGPTATILVKDGTLKKGDPIVVGAVAGKVRTMFNERMQEVKEAGPGTPVLVCGLDGLPRAGDKLIVTSDEREAKELAKTRSESAKDTAPKLQTLTLKTLKSKLESEGTKELRIVLKADSDGTREAIRDLIEHLDFKEVKPKIIHAGIGDINESDVLLAAASQAIVIGFSVRTDNVAKELAKRESVEIRTYRLIYDLEDELISAMEGLLEPVLVENKIGVAEVRNIFKIANVGIVAGCAVIEGVLRRGAFVKLKRAGEIIGEGKISNLKRFKDDVKEVQRGFECGVALEGTPEIFVGDILEAFERVESLRKLRPEKQQ